MTSAGPSASSLAGGQEHGDDRHAVHDFSPQNHPEDLVEGKRGDLDER
jgi:hypothetical protein